MTVTAVVVSHDSAFVLPRCLASLARQSLAPNLIVVDSGSHDKDYLRKLAADYAFTLIESENIGFARANNLAMRHVPNKTEMLVFINPDVVMPPDYLAKAARILAARPACAVVAGVLEGFDFAQGKPTGRYDSTGVFRAWYGRWHDRDQGRETASAQRQAEVVPALCGALLCCRWQALRPFYPDIFAPEFFLYKEDIEFCLRLRESGWNILFTPELHAFHGRGWRGRAAMAKALRLTAARSEILLYRRHPSPYMFWAVLKYLAARWGNF
ncbi:MAG: glycosyltransferase family 2 protein [Desulfobulbaceae bacterium]|nr:glycosyltransferase family 2 protein [Desulfobulbaceae bacterium]